MRLTCKIFVWVGTVFFLVSRIELDVEHIFYHLKLYEGHKKFEGTINLNLFKVCTVTQQHIDLVLLSATYM